MKGIMVEDEVKEVVGRREDHVEFEAMGGLSTLIIYLFI